MLQADIDGNGPMSDGDIDNTATADSNQTGPSSDSEDVPVIYDPRLAIDKIVVDVDGAGANGSADKAGDVITYQVKVTNTGNVTLTGVSVVDPLTGANISGITIAPGATYTTPNLTYTVLQADLNDNGGGDGEIDNTATADSNETGSSSDSESVMVKQIKTVDLEKLVSINGTTFVDADTAVAGPQNVAVQSAVFFKVTVDNTGNVDLTNVKITDVNTTLGEPGTTITLFENGMLNAALVGPANSNLALSGDTGNDGILGVDEVWTLTYTQGFDFGQHVNTAFVTTAQQAADNDAAYYFGILEGPGVRTPGFWQGLNNGALFWNGIQGDSKTGAGFTKNGDLLIYGNTQGVGGGDANNDGVVTAADKGLLIGDYNLNGRTDAGEDTLFISFSDATRLIDSSQKTMAGDGVEKLGRDVVATWLNYLAGNGIGGENDVQSPRHFIDDAVDWLQTFGDSNASNLVNPAETFDRYSSNHAKVASSSAFWNSPQGGIDDSASTLHSVLDNYNNTGDTFAGGDPYAMNSHSAFDMMLMQAAQSITP